MNILVISNDQYFSSGMLNLLQEEGYNCHARNFDNLYRNSLNIIAVDYDLVILDITLVKNTQNLLPLNGALTNALFVVDIQSAFIEDNRCFISKRNSANEFIKKIDRYVEFKIPKVNQIEFEALQLSNSGYNMTSISSYLNITEKSAYRLRYNLVLKFGFLRYHPLTAAYCELMFMFFMHQQPLKISAPQWSG
ncbi:hypothetical protein DET57_11092 [Klebsiella oxytoca]|uniref:Uncharacterized protein n=1 Tax=Klebsiella oxytoca TaxID=571 RepID=A0A318FN38_KLEOX|nr:response regulator transcription factor [Klebsiella oxytoca]PXW43978.1 hypothetical protein DET57_11092 [Klebsiella oxytoca]